MAHTKNIGTRFTIMNKRQISVKISQIDKQMKTNIDKKKLFSNEQQISNNMKYLNVTQSLLFVLFSNVYA